MKTARSILSVMAISVLCCLGMAACVDGDQATADDQQVQAPADEVATPEPAAEPSSMKPIKPGTRWCAWPPSCTNPDAACCTAECVQIGTETLCSND